MARRDKVPNMAKKIRQPRFGRGKNKNEKILQEIPETTRHLFSSKFIGILADEVAKTVVKRLPSVLPRPRRRKKKKKNIKLKNAFFLDTSAIIDGRIFEFINASFVTGPFVLLESILLELKHIADSKDKIRKERGRKGLDSLSVIKKKKGVKFVVLDSNGGEEVDELLIKYAKENKGKILTCDFNLAKKAMIAGVKVININSLANILKIKAIPGESLKVNVLHLGKDQTQGVGYLDDGTMVVVEDGKRDIGKQVEVKVTRVIQTTAGRMIFAKKI